MFNYFGLTSEERILVIETVEILMPSIRPRSFRSPRGSLKTRSACLIGDVGWGLRREARQASGSMFATIYSYILADRERLN